MSQDQRRIAFIRALIAAAWADGELSSQEIRTLSHYLQRFQITDSEYQRLQPLLREAMPPDEAIELLEEQLRLLDRTEEQRTLLAAVEDLLVVDDKLHPDEAVFLRHLRELTSNLATAQLFVSRAKALWSVPPRPGSAPPSGRDEMTDFLQRRLLEHFRGRISVARARAGMSVEDGISDRDLYRTVIWAGLLNEVLKAEHRDTPMEQQQLIQLLGVTGTVLQPDLQVVLSTFSDGSLIGLDLSLLVREFVQISTPEDSVMLLDGLFLVAAADGELSEREVGTIRQIVRSAGLPERSFNAAWERCRRRMSSGWN